MSTLQQLCDNASDYVLMESLDNGLQPQSGATPLFSMRTVDVALMLTLCVKMGPYLN